MVGWMLSRQRPSAARPHIRRGIDDITRLERVLGCPR